MSERRKERLSCLGLVFITIWSALQYVFIKNVPDSVPDFAFLCITSLIGLIIVAAVSIKKIKQLKKATLLKGALLALELVGFNFFMIIGSKDTSPVLVSGIISLYFVFVAPMLLILRRGVSFRSVVAGLISAIAMLLLFDADVNLMFSSSSIIYLMLSAICFASSIVTVSILGENEDPTLLTLSELIFCAFFSLIGWLIQARLQGISVSLPGDFKFWLSALFMGVLIKALYSIIQFSAQKHVQPVKTSLIISSETFITLLLNPLMNKLFGTEYEPITLMQIVACVLFVLAMLLIDDGFMERFGYRDMGEVSFVADDGKQVKGSSISKKIVNLTLIISILAITLSTFICLAAIYKIKDSTVEGSTDLGQQAALQSETALKTELESSMTQIVKDKADYADSILCSYADAVSVFSEYTTQLLSSPEDYAYKEVMYPLEENGGIWAMQRTLCSEEVDYTSIQDESALLGNIEDIFAPYTRHNENISTIYLATESGLMVSYDPYSDTAATGGESYYNFKASDWYNSGKAAKEPAFTSAYQDVYGRGLTVTCYAPFQDAEGNFYGVVAMDILIDTLNTALVSSGIEEPAEALLMDGEGIAIAGKNVSNDSDSAMLVTDEALDSPVRFALSEVLSAQSGIALAGDGDSGIYIAYSTIGSTGWKLCLSCPVSYVIEPAVQIRQSIDSNTSAVSSTIEKGIRTIIEYCLILFAVIILAITIVVGRVSQRISMPLKMLEKDVRSIGTGNLDKRTSVKTTDEIGSLATTFNLMASSLQRYIRDLRDATAKEERIASELSLATQIQASMLPSVFPPFPEHDEFDIYASMKPAKEVGGDFYDFFLIDETHLGLVIADVSGKGIPAALFMVIAKTLIKNRALMGGKPSEILKFVNMQLLEGNEAEMFVTAWLGILDLKTGVLTAANAGHEFPVVGRKDAPFEFIKDKHGFVLAGMDMVRYTDYEIKLEPGDRLLVYTDGVPEATNAGNELFGTDRLLSAMNARPFTSCSNMIGDITDAIAGFVKDAPQFDDTTMLCVEFKKLAE